MTDPTTGLPALITRCPEPNCGERLQATAAVYLDHLAFDAEGRVVSWELGFSDIDECVNTNDWEVDGVSFYCANDHPFEPCPSDECDCEDGCRDCNDEEG